MKDHEKKNDTKYYISATIDKELNDMVENCTEKFKFKKTQLLKESLFWYMKYSLLIDEPISSTTISHPIFESLYTVKQLISLMSTSKDTALIRKLSQESFLLFEDIETSLSIFFGKFEPSNNNNPSFDFDILLIDDQEKVTKVSSYFFKSKNLTFHSCDSIKTARRFLQNHKPYTILLDIRLGNEKKSAQTFCRDLKSDERTQDINIYFYSALSFNSEKRKALIKETGADGFIGKNEDLSQYLELFKK